VQASEYEKLQVPIRLRSIITLLIILVPFLFAGYGTYDELCEKNEKSGDENCTSHYAATVFFWQVGKFLQDYNGAITAIATVIIAYLTYTIYKATVALKNLGRDEFYASHRPRLVIRRVRFRDDLPLRIGFVITNVGDADAEIEQSDVQAVVSGIREGARRLDYNFPPNNRVGSLRIGVGETGRPNPVNVDGVTDRPEVAMRQTTYAITLYGYLLYKNPGGARGYTAFHRTWHHALQEFVKPEIDEQVPEYDRPEYIN
jgi:hypothetical protein